MPSIPVIIIAALGIVSVGEFFLMKSAWQEAAAEKQALAQAAEAIKTLTDAQKERTGIDTACSGMTIDQLIARLHSGEPCK